MQRYFVGKETIRNGRCHIQGGDLHHIRDVMRFRRGQIVTISVTEGPTYFGTIESISREEAVVLLGDLVQNDVPDYSITVAQAMIRKERFELFLEKATEFGVTRIIPTSFARSIVKIDNEKEDRKLLRYQAIVKEAAEQSQRHEIPVIQPFTTLFELSFSTFDKVLVCYEQEVVTNHIRKVIPTLDINAKILIVIGPEGGITPEEVELLKQKGASFVSLGRRIFRSESAALMILSAFMYEWEV